MGDIWLAHNLWKTVVIVTCVLPVKMRFFFFSLSKTTAYFIMCSYPTTGAISVGFATDQSQRQEKKGLSLLLLRVLAAAVGRCDGQIPLAKNCHLEQKTRVSDGKSHEQ